MQLKFKEILAPYLPPQTLEQVVNYIILHKIQLRITRNRRSKLGDYRAPGRTNAHRITINGTLNPYYFYLVFLHELAHLVVWTKYQHRVSPHGKHWRSEMAALLLTSVQEGLFPKDLETLIIKYTSNIKATFASSPDLWRYLNADEEGDSAILESVPINTYFVASNGRLFKKEEKLRKKYRCYCLTNRRWYLFHPFAAIRVVKEDELSEMIENN